MSAGQALQSPAGTSLGESVGSPRPETSRVGCCGETQDKGSPWSGRGGHGSGGQAQGGSCGAVWGFAATSPSTLAAVPVLKGAGLRAAMSKWMSNVREQACASEEDFW